MSKTDCHLLRQKVCQKISVIITNTCVFCCLQDKTRIKMLKWTILLISTKVYVLITEIFWRTFWHNKWWSVFDVVKDSSSYFNLKKEGDSRWRLVFGFQSTADPMKIAYGKWFWPYSGYKLQFYKKLGMGNLGKSRRVFFSGKFFNGLYIT